MVLSGETGFDFEVWEMEHNFKKCVLAIKTDVFTYCHHSLSLCLFKLSAT